MEISWQAFVVSPADQKQGGFPGRSDRDGAAGGWAAPWCRVEGLIQQLVPKDRFLTWVFLERGALWVACLTKLHSLNVLNCAWLYENWHRRLQLSLFVARWTVNHVASLVLVCFLCNSISIFWHQDRLFSLQFVKMLPFKWDKIKSRFEAGEGVLLYLSTSTRTLM